MLLPPACRRDPAPRGGRTHFSLIVNRMGPDQPSPPGPGTDLPVIATRRVLRRVARDRSSDETERRGKNRFADDADEPWGVSVRACSGLHPGEDRDREGETQQAAL